MRRWMRGSSPRMTVEYVATLLRRRTRPWPLRAAQAFKSLRQRENAVIVEAAADDLDADRETGLVIAAVDRHRGIFRHVPCHGVGDVLERLCGVIDGRGELGSELHHRRHRR